MNLKEKNKVDSTVELIKSKEQYDKLINSNMGYGHIYLKLIMKYNHLQNQRGLSKEQMDRVFRKLMLPLGYFDQTHEGR